MIESNPTKVVVAFVVLLEERRVAIELTGARSACQVLLALELTGVFDRAALDLCDDQLGDGHAGTKDERHRVQLPRRTGI